MGTVTYNGKPAAGAHLMFTSTGGRPGFADVDEKGQFDAYTFKPGDGVLVGEHKVTIMPHYTEAAEAKAAAKGRQMDDGKTADLTQWWPDRKEPWKVTVERGKVNKFDLKIEE